MLKEKNFKRTRWFLDIQHPYTLFATSFTFNWYMSRRRLWRDNKNATNFTTMTQHHMTICDKHGIPFQEWHTLTSRRHWSLSQSGSDGKSLPFMMIVEEHDVTLVHWSLPQSGSDGRIQGAKPWCRVVGANLRRCNKSSKVFFKGFRVFLRGLQ
jgi:hypothetical protein